jgi:hypothetical protein
MNMVPIHEADRSFVGLVDRPEEILQVVCLIFQKINFLSLLLVLRQFLLLYLLLERFLLLF